jgi:hypothetical protein
MNESIEFYQNALERIASICGIISPVQLIAMSETGENSVDVLCRHLSGILDKAREKDEEIKQLRYAMARNMLPLEALLICEKVGPRCLGDDMVKEIKDALSIGRPLLKPVNPPDDEKTLER